MKFDRFSSNLWIKFFIDAAIENCIAHIYESKISIFQIIKRKIQFQQQKAKQTNSEDIKCCNQMNDSLYKYLSEPLFKFEIVMHFGMFCTFAAERLKREENQGEKKIIWIDDKFKRCKQGTWQDNELCFITRREDKTESSINNSSTKYGKRWSLLQFVSVYCVYLCVRSSILRFIRARRWDKNKTGRIKKSIEFQILYISK